MLRFSTIMAAAALAVFAGPTFAENAAEAPNSPVSSIPAEGGISGSAAPADSGAAAARADARRAAADSARAQAANKRAAAYKATAAGSAAPLGPSRVDAAGIFRSDAADAPGILRYRSAASVSIPFSLSSGMNRLLPYGNTAPTWYLASPAFAAPPSPFYAPRYHSGGVSGAQASEFALSPESGFAWLPHPDALAAPELAIFWENGVFDQNTLSLRLSRPLSRNLMLNIFSDYRYLEGTRFDHEGNDMVIFYEYFRPDTSTIMNRGYNPLTDEHALGAGLEWYGADSSKLHAAFTYNGAQNEYALNSPGVKAPSPDRLNWALLERRSYRVDAALLNKKLWILDASVKTAFAAENIASLYEPDTAIATGTGGTGSFIGSADAALPNGFGVALSGIVKNMEFFNGAKETYSQGDPKIFYKRGFSLGFAGADIDLSAGAALFPWNDTIYMTPKAKAAAALSPNGGAKLNIYAALDGITVYPDYDTSLYDMYRPWIDQFAELGADGTLPLGYFGAALGYRFTTGIDPFTVRASWPQGIPPYAQPNHTIIISPWMPRLNGFSLLSRTFVTDTKPYVKTSAALSYIIQPRGMSHTFETELGFEYWSERDPVMFAGLPGWNGEIYDLNLKITAHIKTFRLFWKVDNLLNTRYAYVPGYFSPGLTFRWGLNWFLL